MNRIKKVYVVFIENPYKYSRLPYLFIKDLYNNDINMYFKRYLDETIDDKHIVIVEGSFEYFLKSYLHTNKYNLVDCKNIVDKFLYMNFYNTIYNISEYNYVLIDDFYFFYITPALSKSSTILNYIQYSTYFNNSSIENKFVININDGFIYKKDLISKTSMFGEKQEVIYKLHNQKKVIDDVMHIIDYAHSIVNKHNTTDFYIKLLQKFNKNYIDVYNELFYYESKHNFNILSKFIFQNRNNMKYLTEYYTKITNDIQFGFGNVDSCFCLEYYLPLNLDNISVEYFRHQTNIATAIYDTYKIYQPLNAFLNIFAENMDLNFDIDKVAICNECVKIYPVRKEVL